MSYRFNPLLSPWSLRNIVEHLTWKEIAQHLLRVNIYIKDYMNSTENHVTIERILSYDFGDSFLAVLNLRSLYQSEEKSLSTQIKLIYKDWNYMYLKLCSFFKIVPMTAVGFDFSFVDQFENSLFLKYWTLQVKFKLENL